MSESKSLYEITGRIEDINTVLVQRQEFEALAQAARQALEALEAQHVEHFMSIRVGAITALRGVLEATPQPAAAEQEPVAHDEDLLEQLYWEFDHQRQKTGGERLAFKGKMRFYASEFRRRSMGKMAFAQPVSDDMMNLADRLGMEYDDVDPRAWKHLLVYAPQPARQPLTDEQIQDIWCSARIEANQHGPFWFARAIERAHHINHQE